MEQVEEKQQRSLSAIAKDILRDWKNMCVYAKPYVLAMSDLSTLDDGYWFEDGESIVLKFLANAQTWRGEVARKVKQELREMLELHQRKGA